MLTSSPPHLDNPWTGESLPSPKLSTADEALELLEKARLAQVRWARTGIDERIALCERLCSQLAERSEDLISKLVEHLGKPRKLAQAEIDAASETVAYLSSIALEMLVDLELPTSPGDLRHMSQEPVGVVVRVPYSAQALLSSLQIAAPAILAGNAVILVGAPRAAALLSLLEELFLEADAPDNLLLVATLSLDDLQSLCSQPAVGHLAFAGKEEQGRRLYSALSAQRLLNVGLELGGNNAAYVAQDARVNEAVEELVAGIFAHSGQCPWKTHRVYVHESRYDEFLELAAKQIRALELGSVDAGLMGPLLEAESAAILEERIAQAKDAGARVLIGGGLKEGEKGRFFSPVLLADVDDSLPLMREGSCGPVLAVAKVASDGEAVARINDSRFGLAASVWTVAPLRAERLAIMLDMGTVFMNRYPAPDPSLPWNARKDSGRGSLLSHWAFSPMTRRKAWSFVIKDKF